MKSPIVLKCALVSMAAWSLCFGQIEVPSGTKVSCRLEQTISSATADEGQQVQLSVTENVKVKDVVVIPQGAPVVGTIVQSLKKRRMGRTGKLDFSIDKVKTTDGEYVPLRYSLTKKEGGSNSVSTGVMTAGAAILFWPAAPFLLLRQGKDVTINKGIVFEVFTDQDHVIKNASSNAPGSTTAATPTPGGLTPVSISSNVTGADIEIDGAFVGSTPSTQSLTPGMHHIAVKSGSQVWERNLQVQAGNPVNVTATLGPRK